MSAARIVGTTIGSMMMSEPIRIDDVPSATTPLGWSTISFSQPASASNASMAPQRRATAAGDRPLNRGRGVNALPAKKTGSSSMANVSVQAMKSHGTVQTSNGRSLFRGGTAKSEHDDLGVHGLRGPGDVRKERLAVLAV